MSTPNELVFDDTLLLVNFSKASSTIETFFDLLKQKMTGPSVTFQTAESNGEEVYYFESKNKYFSARVQILFADEETFALESESPLGKFENFIFVIESLDDWTHMGCNLKALQLLRKSQKFKSLVLNESIIKKIDINGFYDIIESYISVFSISVDASSIEDDENGAVIDEIIDMIANNVWNHKPVGHVDSTPKLEGHIESDNAQEKVVKDDKEEGFFSAFDKIMNFKMESQALSPKTRKLKACEIMMNLVSTFDEEGFEDFECPPSDDFDGYSKI
jgi:hypothetical protein